LDFGVDVGGGGVVGWCASREDCVRDANQRRAWGMSEEDAVEVGGGEVALFARESAMLGEVHKAVVAALKPLAAGGPPAAARICLDNLTVANMCLQQLAYVLSHQDELRSAAVDAAVAKFGKKP
jgi:hypothetical protein